MNKKLEKVEAGINYVNTVLKDNYVVIRNLCNCHFNIKAIGIIRNAQLSYIKTHANTFIPIVSVTLSPKILCSNEEVFNVSSNGQVNISTNQVPYIEQVSNDAVFKINEIKEAYEKIEKVSKYFQDNIDKIAINEEINF